MLLHVLIYNIKKRFSFLIMTQILSSFSLTFKDSFHTKGNLSMHRFFLFDTLRKLINYACLKNLKFYISFFFNLTLNFWSAFVIQIPSWSLK